jgi:hypothetical protein
LICARRENSLGKEMHRDCRLSNAFVVGDNVDEEEKEREREKTT